MIEKVLPIVMLGVLVAAVGSFVILGMMRRYRRELGDKQEEQEKTRNVSFVIGAFQDVTRQLKEKEKELERLRSLAEQRAENVESYTENILQCVTSGVITFDGNGLSTTMNRSAEEILGLERSKALGRTCGEIFGEGDTCRLVQDTLQKGIPSRRMETELVRQNDRIWLGFNTALLMDRQGKSLGVILSFSDLTEVKRLQEQMELKERLTALGEMSAGIAHELRNPMAVIAGYLNLLAKNQDGAGRAVIKDVLAEITGMNRIIGDLLTFARPTALNRTEVNMRELIETCVSTVLLAKGADARIATVLELGEENAFVDEVLMRQALGNLVQNAVEAMPDGGTLTVRSQSDREMVITIKDTGTGVPREQYRKIFLPFFTTKDTGVGMGLA
ncbi:MAG TPA: histidine kinase dimerization/phospho-acceptor domain-containing protein, partial [Geobacteraceae bacterium]|nr:histidine kinase dimerization/phospho-acceptor domain-containing protein [Geobacteraceae bacterium]